MCTAPVKAIALPAVYRANLEFQSHVPFQHSRTRSRIRARADAEGSALKCIHYSLYSCIIYHLNTKTGYSHVTETATHTVANHLFLQCGCML